MAQVKWVAIILTSLLVSACGGAKHVQSSVTVTEYVIKERVVHDTVPVMRDTTIYKDSVRIEIQYIKDAEGNVTSMSFKAECPPSKVKVITQTITVEKEKRERKPWWSRFIWPAAFIVSFVSIAAIWLKRLMR
jgi:hypothetical protein